jgi:hypothetical protein
MYSRVQNHYLISFLELGCDIAILILISLLNVYKKDIVN